MSTVVDEVGVQVLPDVRDDLASVNGYTAALCLNGDLRTTNVYYRGLAGRLYIQADNS